jgi:hypothetical protein
MRSDAPIFAVNNRYGTHAGIDVELLNHEIFESKFEGIFQTDYEPAHSASEKSGRFGNHRRDSPEGKLIIRCR